MEKIQKDYSTSAIVARFQVHELTAGHIDLLKKVTALAKRTVVFLGLTPCKCTFNNPLDFQARKVMINETFPDIEVYYIHDMGSHILWSDNLDAGLKKIGCASEDTCLYGSRDSFIQYYSGTFDTCELEQEVFTSGTDIRKKIGQIVEKSAGFRAGVIWATHNQWKMVLPTIDVVIFNEAGTKILLGKKAQEPHYRFIGGFGEPGEDFDTTAARETKEEANIDVDGLEYVKSFVISDWRYASEMNKITTILYKTIFKVGSPAPGDDIDELRWFPFNKFTIASIMPEHREMLTYLLEHN